MRAGGLHKGGGYILKTSELIYGDIQWNPSKKKKGVSEDCGFRYTLQRERHAFTASSAVESSHFRSLLGLLSNHLEGDGSGKEDRRTGTKDDTKNHGEGETTHSITTEEEDAEEHQQGGK